MWTEGRQNIQAVRFTSNRLTYPQDVCDYTHIHTHCISNHSHNVSTGVETVSISGKLNRAAVPFIQNTQTPPGDFCQPVTEFKVKSFDFRFIKTSLRLQLNLFL